MKPRVCSLCLLAVLLSTAPARGQALPPEASSQILAWEQWQLRGQLIDDEETLRAVLAAGVMSASGTEDAKDKISALLARVGYDLIELTLSKSAPVVATLAVAPVRVVRTVSVSVDRGLLDLALDDELSRRIRLRVGAPLPRLRADLSRALRDDQEMLLEYLQDEGYFDATVAVTLGDSDIRSSRVSINAVLGERYKIGTIDVLTGGTTAVTADEIRALFRRPAFCLPVVPLCAGDAPYSLTRYQTARLQVIDLFQRRGYPNVQLIDSDPRQGFDRRSKTVRLRLRIDERRQTDVEFEGNDKLRFPDDALRQRLTFSEARSADDGEAAASAARIAEYYQERGRFDTQVTFLRQRFDQIADATGATSNASGRQFDRVYFRIDEGGKRTVRSLSFVGNRALSDGELSEIVATQPAGSLASGAVTGVELREDVDRLRQAYLARGYLAATVEVSASAEPGEIAPGLNAALVAAGRGAQELHVRFSIREGPQTQLTRMRLVLGDSPQRSDATARCRGILGRGLAAGAETEQEGAARRKRATFTTTADGCAADLGKEPFRLALTEAATGALRDALRSIGYARAEVTAEVEATGDPHQVTAVYRANLGPRLRFGKLIVRGNTRTQGSVIAQEFGLREGQLASTVALEAAPQRVRDTGLFDAVSVDYVGQEAGDGPVTAVVRVEERYPQRALFEAEGGWSSRQGLFGRLTGRLPNMFGRGIASQAAGTYGQLFQAAEASFTIPRWVVRRATGAPISAEVSGLWQFEDTERFGDLTSYGGSVAALRQWQLSRTSSRRPSLTIASLRYDFRVRNRQEEAVRVAGSGVDLATVPVSTRTASIGVGLRSDRRVGSTGELNPLAPVAGSFLDVSASFASPAVLGQDSFVKVSGNGQLYVPITRNVRARADLRFDQGFPLGDAQLLPEVERFFAGGDDTVRGYARDRLKTEVLYTEVAPFDGVTQARVLPAGGNIRGLASAELQYNLGTLPWAKGVTPAVAAFVDAGFIENRWASLTLDDVRPGVGGAIRGEFGFFTVSIEYAVPLRPTLGDDGKGTVHWGVSFRQ